jgi:hypothetical protein
MENKPKAKELTINIEDNLKYPERRTQVNNTLSSSISSFRPAKTDLIENANKSHIITDLNEPSSLRKVTALNNNNIKKYFMVKSTNFFFPKILHEEDRRIGKQMFISRIVNENKNENKADNWKQMYFLLKIIEKSIFYFNQMKFKECFDLLISEKLIRNNIEFGIYLIAIEGFDKNLLTEFLSTSANDEILNTFLNCFNMEFANNKSLIISLKCLLSLINSPTKVIIDKFSDFYYENNKNNSTFMRNFKKKEVLTTLINSIITLNNVFIGKEKDKNNLAKIDQFVKMNKDLDKKYIQNIHKYIQAHPISSLDSYLQKMYKKLSFLSKEYDENEIYDKASDMDSFYEQILNDNPTRNYTNCNTWFSYRKKLSEFSKEDEQVLLKPTIFTKFVSNSTSSHPRAFILKDNFTNLIWAKSIEGEKMKGNVHNVKLEDIIDIYLGVYNNDTLKKYLKSNSKDMEEEYNFITIKTKTEIYTIKAENITINFKWYKALKSLILKQQSLKNNDKERINKNNIDKMEGGIQKIWKNCIYNKWTEYGRYLLYKKQNILEFKKAINQNNKREKIIRSDLIDDKMNFNIKKITSFMTAIKSKINDVGIENFALDYNEFFFLYKIGLPKQCRPILWDCLIDNACGITRDIYDYYSLKIEESNEGLNFNHYIKLYEQNHSKKDLNFHNNSEINQIIIDLIKTKDLFVNELYILQKTNEELLSIIYRLVKIFFMMRKDISYNKSIVNYAFVFFLVFKDEFVSFKNLYNFICSSNILKYLAGDSDDIPRKSCMIDFDDLLSQSVPAIYQHFNRLDINSELYTFFWYQNLFTLTLNYKIIIRVIDRYLIYGDELLTEVGLTIIKIQEEDLLNYTVNEIFQVLRRLPNKYDEELFFETLESMYKPEINNFIISETIKEQKKMLEI